MEPDALPAGRRLAYHAGDEPAARPVFVDVIVRTYRGIHGRPSSLLAEHCARYEDCDIRLYHGSFAANAKSPIELLMAGIEQGAPVWVVVSPAAARPREYLEMVGSSVASLLSDANLMHFEEASGREFAYD